MSKVSKQERERRIKALGELLDKALPPLKVTNITGIPITTKKLDWFPSAEREE